MTDDELIDAIQSRVVDPKKRIDATTVDAPPLYKVATQSALDDVGTLVGFPIPVLLRRLYMEVGNGGFGPGAGMIGVDGGHRDIDGRSLGALYADLRAQGWPKDLLPLCDWGGGAWAALDREARVVTMNESGPTLTGFTIASWLQAWTSGVDMFAETFEIMDGILTNPFTHKPIAVKRRGRAKGVPF